MSRQLRLLIFIVRTELFLVLLFIGLLISLLMKGLGKSSLVKLNVLGFLQSYIDPPIHIKFMFSKKATKIDNIFTVDLTLCSKRQIDSEDFVNFHGLFRKYEL